MAGLPEPEAPKAAAKQRGVGHARGWGLSLLVASVILLLLGRKSQALAFGVIGALLAVGSLLGAKRKQKRKRSA